MMICNKDFLTSVLVLPSGEISSSSIASSRIGRHCAEPVRLKLGSSFTRKKEKTREIANQIEKGVSVRNETETNTAESGRAQGHSRWLGRLHSPSMPIVRQSSLPRQAAPRRRCGWGWGDPWHLNAGGGRFTLAGGKHVAMLSSW